MFFGVEVKSNQNQAKPLTLTRNLKLTNAVLEPVKNGKREPVCLVAEYNKKQSILCVIDPNHSWQSPLDLLFEGGSNVKFFLRGSGTVHLTGYDVIEEADDISMSMSSDDDEDEVVDTTKEAMPIKTSKSPKALTNGSAKLDKKRKRPEDEDSEDLEEFFNGEDDDDSDDDYNNYMNPDMIEDLSDNSDDDDDDFDDEEELDEDDEDDDDDENEDEEISSDEDMSDEELME